VLPCDGGDLWKLRRGVQRDSQMRKSAGAVRTRAGGTVRMAVLVTIPVLSAGLRALRLMRVLERQRERLQRIARARSPGLRERRSLRFVLVLLAVVLLRMKQRCDHEAENCDRGEQQPSV
jgi:hypothetical protein